MTIDGMFVHIGLPKTGTTALQRHLFPSLVEGCVLGARNPGEPRTLSHVLFHHLRTEDDEGYSEATVRAFLTDSRARAPGALLVSDELLSGMWGADVVRHGTERQASERQRTAERLRALLPEAGILLVVRHQGAMLRSVYGNYISAGGYVSVSEFLEDRAPGWSFDPAHHRYDRLVGLYQQLFGSERVKVLPYELLRADPAAFLRELASFLGARETLAVLPRENVSATAPARRLLRVSNRLFRRSPYNRDPKLWDFPAAANVVPRLSRRGPTTLRRGHASPESEADEITRRLPDYEQSNARLEEMTGLDLGRFDYPLPVARRSSSRGGIAVPGE